jgi:hypothetical protein
MNSTATFVTARNTLPAAMIAPVFEHIILKEMLERLRS